MLNGLRSNETTLFASFNVPTWGLEKSAVLTKNFTLRVACELAK
jgi:hypothetical protein